MWYNANMNEDLKIEVLPRGNVVEKEEELLSPQHEEFAYLYVFDEELNADATGCYSQVYNTKDKMVAASCASRLLKLAKIQKKIRELLNIKGFNSEFADAKLLNLANSGNSKVSLDSVKEMNRVLGRIVSKQQTTLVDANRLLEQLKEQKMANETANSY